MLEAQSWSVFHCMEAGRLVSFFPFYPVLILFMTPLMWLKSWMKIIESKDVLKIKKVFIEELSSA